MVAKASSKPHTRPKGNLPLPEQPLLAVVVVLVLAGVALRLFDLPNQILLDDEWHSLNFVADRSLRAVVFTQGLGANSIPQNVYNYLLLRTVGWSEMLLRLPSIVGGLLALTVFPVLLWRRYGPLTATVFTSLLAISPVVIFYSRVSRPYALVLLFAFLALLFFIRWVHEHRTSDLLTYGMSGVLAIYLHLYAVFPVLVPLGCLGLIVLTRIRTGYPLPALKAVISVSALMFALAMVLLLPATLENPWWLNVSGEDEATWATAVRYVTLVSGTVNPLVGLLFAGLTMYGCGVLIRRDFPVGVSLAAAFVTFAVYISLSTQEAMHAAIQVARYSIAFVPVMFLLIGLACDEIRKGGRVLMSVALPSLLVIGAVWSSPLWHTYRGWNNFTNQSAFQDSYVPIDWSFSRVRDLSPLPVRMPSSRIPAFYRESPAVAAAQGVVEYPMLIGDDLNLYYYYQHVHQKPVAIGYLQDRTFQPLPSGDRWVYGDTPIDYVLARTFARHGAMNFRNLVSLSDGSLSERNQNWILIVHRNIVSEMFPELKGTPRQVPDPVIVPDAVIASLKDRLGAPIHEDQHLLAWRVR